jgi:hypothetical protein
MRMRKGKLLHVWRLLLSDKQRILNATKTHKQGILSLNSKGPKPQQAER